jgi:predicted RNase H-like HicB family nuclease
MPSFNNCRASLCAKLITNVDYAVIFEKTSTGWSAYVPDLPGLGVAGSTYEATEQLIREGINFHIEGLRADGDPIPEPTTRVARMPISA